jgi:DNA-binding NarL/FixJ family response regulator
MYHIAIVEDNLEIRKSLSDYFAHSQEVECVLAVDTVEKFLKFHRDFMGIQLILLDVMLYQQSSIRSIPLIRQREPEAEIVMFTVMDDYDTIFQALRNGANGYLLKDSNLPELEAKIIFTLEGKGALISPPVAKRMIQHFNPHATSNKAAGPDNTLTDKESVVVRMLKEGHAYDTIARHLGISLDGVRYHVKNVYRKLHVKSKGELIRKDIF